MRRIAVRPAKGYEDRINFSQNLCVFTFKNPTTLRLIIRIEDTQPLRLPVRSFLFCPDLVLIICLLHLRFVQVVCVEDERFTLSEKDPAESRARLTATIGVDYV